MKIRIAAPFLLSALAASAFAADYMDSAPVVSSVPVYQTISEPQQQCWTESITSYYSGRNSIVVLPYDPGPRVPIEVGVSGVASRSTYVGPPVERIGYEQRRVPIWEVKPYKRPRHHDDDDRDWRH
jgi:hypothetical protein